MGAALRRRIRPSIFHSEFCILNFAFDVLVEEATSERVAGKAKFRMQNRRIQNEEWGRRSGVGSGLQFFILNSEFWISLLTFSSRKPRASEWAGKSKIQNAESQNSE